MGKNWLTCVSSVACLSPGKDKKNQVVGLSNFFLLIMNI